jgi:psiF repeat-containing protein
MGPVAIMSPVVASNVTYPNRRLPMKFSKTAALGALAATALLGSTAFAATATPAANEAHASCSQQAKGKHLAGAARKSFVKKCRADATRK